MMKFYKYLFFATFVFMYIVGSTGKARIEKEIAASEPPEEIAVGLEHMKANGVNLEELGITDSTVVSKKSKATKPNKKEKTKKKNKKKSDKKSKKKSSSVSMDSNNSNSDAGASEKHVNNVAQSRPNTAPVTQETAVQSALQADVAVATEPSVPQPKHIHEWISTTQTIHHDAVTKKVWVVDEEAWDETLYETRDFVICNGCEHEYARYEEWCDHCDEHFDKGDMTHGSYRIEPRKNENGIKHHKEEGHYEKQIVTPAWDETVTTGYHCSCGATK